MIDPNLNTLRALLKLSSSGSISKAAAELGLTQSAVSRAISTLEKSVKLDLVQRGTRPLRLTDEGQVVAAHARDIAASLATMQQELENFQRNKAGSVRLSSFGASASARILPPLLKRFTHRYPGIMVQITETDDTLALRALQQDRVDLAVISDPGEAFDTCPVATDQLVALLPADHTMKGPLSPDDLSRMPFIMAQGGSQPHILNWFRQAQVEPRITQRIWQTHSIIALVAAGLGVAVVTGLSLPPATPGVTQVALKAAPTTDVVLARKHHPARSHAADVFWDFATHNI